MSLILKPSFSPARASMLTLAAALAVSEGIRRATGLETEIKWPTTWWQAEGSSAGSLRK